MSFVLLAVRSAILGLSDSDAVAIGGLGAFVATVVLAAIAAFQAKQMKAQVVAIRETAESQIDAVRQTAEEQLALVRAQVDASIEQTNTLRELAIVQVRPAVVARPVSGWIFGPNAVFGLRPRQAILPYYLTNEGTGIALNVTHGAHVARGINAMGLGPRVFGIRPGESFPPARNERRRKPSELLYVSLYADEIPRNLRTWPVEFWLDYQNLFGEKLESRFDYTSRTLAYEVSLAQTQIAETAPGGSDGEPRQGEVNEEAD